MDDYDVKLKGLNDIYAQVELEMLKEIASLLRSGKTSTAEWKIEMLDQLGILNKRSLEIVSKYSGLANEEINKLFIEAGRETIKLTDDAMKDAIKQGAQLIIPQGNNDKLNEILMTYANNARTAMNTTNLSLIKTSQQQFIDLINRVEMQVTFGTITREKAIRLAVMKMAEKGLPALIDRAGRQWQIESYLRTVMVTNYGNLVNEMQDQRIDEWGASLVEISSHRGNRPGCVPYAGKIFSLKPNHPKYPYLYDPNVGRYGDPDSLFGINCKHVKYPYFEGISIRANYPNNSQQNEIDYENSQRQRTLERSIRRAKIRKQMMEALEDQEGIKQSNKLITKRQMRMREFIKETGLTRRGYREQIYR